MPLRCAPVLALTLAAALVPAQEPKPDSANSPFPRPAQGEAPEPQLIPSKTFWTPQGKCETRRWEIARLSLDIAEDGHAQNVQVLDSSDANAGALATQIVRGDRFTPAHKNGTPIAVRRSLLLEMKACVDRINQAHGKQAEQIWLDSPPKQAIDPAGSTSTSILDALVKSMGAYRVGEGISPPVPINSPMADPTPEAKRAHFAGELRISLIIDAQGMPLSPHVVNTLPFGLDEVGLAAVRQYRFRPGMKDNIPVPVIITISMHFQTN